jgi:hypothetical protein
MGHILKGALVALALAAAPLAVPPPAQAAVDFSISLGDAAFAYSDGYWDRDHHWHAYRNKAEARYFRDHFRDHYVAARHDRDRKDRNMGWREERWWERR